MFENYIEQQTRKLEGLFDQPSVSIEQIIYNDSLPTYFVNYLRAYINSKSISLYTDLIENYNFSKDSMELAEAWRVFEDTYRNSFEFSSELLQTLIHQSTSLYFNYLVRPQTTLVNFIFQDYLFQSIQNIKERLKYFQDTDYLISRLTLWLEEQEIDNNLPKVNKFQFKKVISSIENEYYKDYESSEINHWFALIDKFINLNNNTKAIDTSIFAIFFDDKKWFGLKNYVIHHFLDKSMTKIEINDVAELINHYLSDALLIENEPSSEEPVFTKMVDHSSEINTDFGSTNDENEEEIDEDAELEDNLQTEIYIDEIEPNELESDNFEIEVIKPNEIEVIKPNEIGEYEIDVNSDTQLGDNSEDEILEANNKLTEDEIDFDILADLIANGNDLTETTPQAETHKQEFISNENNPSTYETIESKLSNLEEKINKLEVPGYQTYLEIADENSYLTMGKLETENLENDSIKKELLEFMLKLKRK